MTRTPLFDIMQGVQTEMEIETAYHGFVDEVFALLASSVDSRNLFVMLQFTELELQCHRQRIADPVLLEYSQKAQDFIGRMMRCLTTQVFPMPMTSETSHEAEPSIRWTGTSVELVELLYAFNELHCFNEGEVTLKVLASHLSSIFGVNIQDCYRTYTDIRNRKNESRTYFLDKLQSKLNEKLRKDDLAETGRR